MSTPNPYGKAMVQLLEHADEKGTVSELAEACVLVLAALIQERSSDPDHDALSLTYSLLNRTGMSAPPGVRAH